MGGPAHGRVYTQDPAAYDESYQLWERGPWKLWVAWEIADPLSCLTANWRGDCEARL